MHSYYKKILLWVVFNTVGTCCFTYIVKQNIRDILLFTTGQTVLTLTLYPPFEYYYTWTPEPPWCTITE